MLRLSVDSSALEATSAAMCSARLAPPTARARRRPGRPDSRPASDRLGARPRRPLRPAHGSCAARRGRGRSGLPALRADRSLRDLGLARQRIRQRRCEPDPTARRQAPARARTARPSGHARSTVMRSRDEGAIPEPPDMRERVRQRRQRAYLCTHLRIQYWLGSRGHQADDFESNFSARSLTSMAMRPDRRPGAGARRGAMYPAARVARFSQRCSDWRPCSELATCLTVKRSAKRQVQGASARADAYGIGSVCHRRFDRQTLDRWLPRQAGISCTADSGDAAAPATAIVTMAACLTVKQSAKRQVSCASTRAAAHCAGSVCHRRCLTVKHSTASLPTQPASAARPTPARCERLPRPSSCSTKTWSSSSGTSLRSISTSRPSYAPHSVMQPAGGDAALAIPEVRAASNVGVGSIGAASRGDDGRLRSLTAPPMAIQQTRPSSSQSLMLSSRRRPALLQRLQFRARHTVRVCQPLTDPLRIGLLQPPQLVELPSCLCSGLPDRPPSASRGHRSAPSRSSHGRGPCPAAAQCRPGFRRAPGVAARTAPVPAASGLRAVRSR